ncbi:MAG: hypothetical protein WC139_00515 [Candidatus Kapaibacterium sp.]
MEIIKDNGEQYIININNIMFCKYDSKNLYIYFEKGFIRTFRVEDFNDPNYLLTLYKELKEKINK